MRFVFISILALGLCFAGVAIWNGFVATKQLETAINLRTAGWAIERARDPDGRIPRDVIVRELSQINDGRDAWGRPIVHAVREVRGRTRFVLVSLGADGRFKLGAIDPYFSMSPHRLSSKRSEDIVVRDGVLITVASK